MSWKNFLTEVINACEEKKVFYEGLEKWIYKTIPDVEKEASAFHVSVGPTPYFQQLLVEVHILTGIILHEFTVNKEGKRAREEYNAYQPKTINAVYRTTSQGYFKFDFISGGIPLLIIEVTEKDLDRTIRFIQQILKTWE